MALQLISWQGLKSWSEIEPTTIHYESISQFLPGAVDLNVKREHVFKGAQVTSFMLRPVLFDGDIMVYSRQVVTEWGRQRGAGRTHRGSHGAVKYSQQEIPLSIPRPYFEPRGAPWLKILTCFSIIITPCSGGLARLMTAAVDTNRCRRFRKKVWRIQLAPLHLLVLSLVSAHWEWDPWPDVEQSRWCRSELKCSYVHGNFWRV